MKKLQSILALLLSLALVGCTATLNKPNRPYTGTLPGISNIEKQNPLLAEELRKLPELQDGTNLSEISALQRLAEYYDTDQEKFDALFKEMDTIGLKNSRKYCSPLQALFWIALTRPIHGNDNFVSPFSLEKLLHASWIFQGSMSHDQGERMINSIKDPDMKREYLHYLENHSRSLVNMLNKDIRLFPDKFDDWVIDELKELERTGPWSDFDEVIDRLNSPELVDYYVQNTIRYVNFWDIAGYNGRYADGDPYYVFLYKRGDCLYISAFIAKALYVNGYSAWIAKMPPLRSTDKWHAVCAYKDQEKKYIIDDGRLVKRGIIDYQKY